MIFVNYPELAMPVALLLATLDADLRAAAMSERVTLCEKRESGILASLSYNQLW